MKTLVAKSKGLKLAGRWDIDFHLPAEGIQKFPSRVVATVAEVATLSKSKRDPTTRPTEAFQYIDIASVDVVTGTIQNPQELTGEEAPSRARKVVRAYDIIISTCRPTRGAIAVVPEALHGQICSTGFSVIRCREDANPFYLHFALRLDSTLEQFRKWSTGSSYPAILDEDVEKTRIPVPTPEEQDRIAKAVLCAAIERDRDVSAANERWRAVTLKAIQTLEKGGPLDEPNIPAPGVVTISEVQSRLAELPIVDENGVEEAETEGLFEDLNGED